MEATAASVPILWLLPVAPIQNVRLYLSECHLQLMRLPTSEPYHPSTITHHSHLNTFNSHLHLPFYPVQLPTALLELSVTPLLFSQSQPLLDMRLPILPWIKLLSASIASWLPPQSLLPALTKSVFVVYTKLIATLSGMSSHLSMAEVFLPFCSRKPGSKVSLPTDHQPRVSLQTCQISTEQATITTTAKPLKDCHHQAKRPRTTLPVSRHFSVLMLVPVALRKERWSKDWRKVGRCVK